MGDGVNEGWEGVRGNGNWCKCGVSLSKLSLSVGFKSLQYQFLWKIFFKLQRVFC